MQNASKQSEAKATGFHSDAFQITRLRLTLIYAVLLLTILITSATVTHSIFSSRLNRRFINKPIAVGQVTILVEGSFRQQAQEELVTSLFVVNGILFIVAVGLSYLLAGATLKPIQEAYDKQRRFLSDASHELRTPLAILHTDLENELSNKHRSEEEKENTTSHLEEVDRMSKIVKDLLLISRLDSNEYQKTAKEFVDLHKVIATSVKRFEKYAEKKGVTLITEADKKKSLIILANEEHIIQAISNLIKNSIDYNNPGGQVKITGTRNNGTINLSIEDNGMGVESSEISKLFDRFYRVDKSRSRQNGGSGLGLSIVKSILTTYGGTIKLNSKVGSGTTAIVTFPANK